VRVAGLLLAGLTLLAIGCSRENSRTQSETWAKVEDFDRVLPPRVWGAIEHADSAEAALVGDLTEPGDRGRPTVELRGVAWRLRSPWKRLAFDASDSLRAILLARESWQPDAKTCTFHANVAFRWFTGTDTTLAVLCHTCDDLVGNADTTRFSGHLDPVGPRLLALDIAIFPADSELVAIIKPRPHPFR
jgi:ABC-type oligopeptide transport system substrate-binding subunit